MIGGGGRRREGIGFGLSDDEGEEAFAETSGANADGASGVGVVFPAPHRVSHRVDSFSGGG